MRKGEVVFLISLALFISVYSTLSIISDIGVGDVKEDKINVGEYKISIEIISPTGKREGTIVLIHGILGSRKMLKPMGLDLARAGWRVILVDQIGHGMSGGEYRLMFSDLSNMEYALQKLINQTEEFRKALAKYVEDHTEEDEYVVFGGHSLGGLLAMIISGEYNARFNILATIGIAPPYMDGVANATIPRNLLLCLGGNDEFIKPNDLEKYAGTGSGGTTGDFSKGTARKVFISPYSDHIFEPYDPEIIGEIIWWLDLCRGISPRRPIILATFIAASKAICALIGLVMVAMIPIVLADKIGMISGGKRFPTIKMIKRSLLASIIVWPVFTLVMLALEFLPMVYLAGYTGYVMPILVGGYLFVAIIALMVAANVLRGGEIGIMYIGKKICVYAKADLERGALLGLVEAGAFMFVLQITLGDILVPMIPMTLDRIVVSIMLGTIIFAYFICHEYLFRAQIQEIFGGKRRRAAVMSIMISTVSKIPVILGISFIVLYVSPFPIVAIVGLIGMMMITLLTEGLAATSYYATREIFPHALASALLWASIVAAAFPIIRILF